MGYFLVQLWLLRNINPDIKAWIFLPFLKYSIFHLRSWIINFNFEQHIPVHFSNSKKLLLLKISIKSQVWTFCSVLFTQGSCVWEGTKELEMMSVLSLPSKSGFYPEGTLPGKSKPFGVKICRPAKGRQEGQQRNPIGSTKGKEQNQRRKSRLGRKCSEISEPRNSPRVTSPKLPRTN